MTEDCVMRGFASVGLVRPKDPANVGGVLRAAYCYDASLVVIAGDRSKAKDGILHGTNTLKSERHIPIIRCNDLRESVPFGAVPVAVDLVDDADHLHAFQHPISAFYVFGPEDGTLDKAILDWCPYRVMVPTRMCMNLAASVNVVLYDRQAKYLRSVRKLELAA
jgi:tRNA(Leu) C34 or U34 (ribose-2'-O)-methylase TrmL